VQLLSSKDDQIQPEETPKALYPLKHVLFQKKPLGPVDQSGMIAAFARRKPRVQIPPGPLNLLFSVKMSFQVKIGASSSFIHEAVADSACINDLESFFRCCPSARFLRDVSCFLQIPEVLGCLGKTQPHAAYDASLLASMLSIEENTHNYVLTIPSLTLNSILSFGFHRIYLHTKVWQSQAYGFRFPTSPPRASRLQLKFTINENEYSFMIPKDVIANERRNAFMLFNEAIVRGALEAGPRVCAQHSERIL
jgi:hypothetical protein